MYLIFSGKVDLSRFLVDFSKSPKRAFFALQLEKKIFLTGKQKFPN